ncbi:hypothetical protein ACQEVZ_22155 [Dactylosporangium sp. CA-152071]|uniref:hypothetical protein n=1 Tax=Dactylosporangium sp. CA-152071 TaxID=3239933 RepID=UPI003D928464
MTTPKLSRRAEPGAGHRCERRPAGQPPPLLRRRPVSERTARDAWTVLRNALNNAIVEELLTRNPAGLVRADPGVRLCQGEVLGLRWSDVEAHRSAQGPQARTAAPDHSCPPVCTYNSEANAAYIDLQCRTTVGMPRKQR